jgi:hypothetical protein
MVLAPGINEAATSSIFDTRTVGPPSGYRFWKAGVNFDCHHPYYLHIRQGTF